MQMMSLMHTVQYVDSRKILEFWYAELYIVS